MRLTPSEPALTRLFHGLLVAEIVLSGMVVCLTMQFTAQLEAAVAAESGVPSPSSPAPAVRTSSPLFQVAAVALVFGMAGAQLASWTGLCFYRNWARWLALGLLIAERGLQIPFAAYSYGLDWHLLDSLSQLRYECTGALLVTVFFTALSTQFQSRRPPG